MLFGVGGPFANCPGIADGDTNGLSPGEAYDRPLGKCEEDDCGLSNRVIVNSDGSLPELLCLRRLLVGPWKSLGDACRERFRGV